MSHHEVETEDELQANLSSQSRGRAIPTSSATERPSTRKNANTKLCRLSMLHISRDTVPSVAHVQESPVDEVNVYTVP